MTTRFAVLGVGQVGVKHIAAIEKIEGAKVTAVVDVNEALGQEVAASCDAAFYNDYEQLLASNTPVDAVINSLPHNLHYESTLRLAEEGLHVLLEKPMCMTVPEADKVIAEFEKRDLKLSIGYVHRFRSEMLEAKRLIDEGKLGQIASVIDNFCSQGGKYVSPWVWNKSISGGGVLMYGGIHALDRLLWFVGDEPVSVYALTQTNSQEVDTECEDGLSAIVHFKNGAVATLVENSPGYLALRTWETEVYGTKGQLSVLFGKNVRFSSDDEASVYEAERYDHFERQMRDFVGAVAEDRSPWITGHDGRQSLALAVAIYQSADEKRPVSLGQHDK